MNHSTLTGRTFACLLAPFFQLRAHGVVALTGWTCTVKSRSQSPGGAAKEECCLSGTVGGGRYLDKLDLSNRKATSLNQITLSSNPGLQSRKP